MNHWICGWYWVPRESWHAAVHGVAKSQTRLSNWIELKHTLLRRKVTTNLDSIFKSRGITLPTKVCLVKAMVFPVVMYGCESWTVKKAEHRRIDAFELWCWRRLLRDPWTRGRSNQSILLLLSCYVSSVVSNSVWPQRQGCPVPGILQARTLEWVAISFSNPWKWKVKVKSLSHVRLLATPWTAAYQAPPPMGFTRQEYWSGVPLPSPRFNAIPIKITETDYHMK